MGTRDRGPRPVALVRRFKAVTPRDTVDAFRGFRYAEEEESVESGETLHVVGLNSLRGAVGSWGNRVNDRQ